MILKVDGRVSPEEAQTLVALGVTHVCVAPAQFAAIRAAIPDAQVGVQLGPEDPLVDGVDFVQAFSPNEIPHAVLDAAVELIVSRLEGQADTDPTWVLTRYEDIAEHVALYQVEILSDYENSWRRWRDECPKYEEELQIHDINQLAKANPMVVSLDFTPDNVGEICERLPEVRGLAFNIGAPEPPNASMHIHELDAVVAVLKVLNNRHT